MKIIATITPGNPKIHDAEISRTEVRRTEAVPVLVQVTMRAKRRRAQAEIKAQYSGDSHARAAVAVALSSRTRQAREDVIAALHNSLQADNARRQQPEPAPDTAMHDPIQQAREFYDTELRPRMEELYDGHYIAIHPESRSYSVQPGYGKAFRELRTKQPLGAIIVHNIGFANSGLKARMRGEQP